MLTQEPDGGGVFEYCPNIRSARAENLDAVRAVLDGRGEPRRLTAPAGRSPAVPRAVLAAPGRHGGGCHRTALGDLRLQRAARRDRQRGADPPAVRPGRARPPGAPHRARRRADGLTPWTCPRAPSATRTTCRASRCPRSTRPARGSCEWCAPLLDAEQLAETEAAVAVLPGPRRPGPGAARRARGLRRPGRAWPAGSTPSGRTATSAGATASRSTPTSSSSSTDGDLGQVERAAGLVAGALDYKALIDSEDAPAGHAARRSRCRWSRTSTCSRPPASRARCRTAARNPYSAAWPGPSTRTAHRGVLPRHHVPPRRDRRRRTAVHRRRDRGRPARGDGCGARARRRRRAPHHEGPGRVGREPAGPARRAPATRRRWTTVETALFCLCLEDVTPAEPARRVRPAAARRQRQPLVRQGRLADRLRGRHGRHQRRALQPRRHHGVSFVDTLLDRRRAPRAGGATRASRPACRSPSASTTRCAPTSRPRARRSPPTRPAPPPRRLSVDFGAERAKALDVLARRVRAAGVPARPPAGEGPRRRHVRVDRHPAVPARPHRGDAGGHARDRGRS